MTFRTRHGFLARIVHGVLFALLAISVKWSSPIQPAAIIQGVLLDPSREQLTRQRKAQAEAAAEAEKKQIEEVQRLKKKQDLDKQTKAKEEAKRAHEEERKKHQEQEKSEQELRNRQLQADAEDAAQASAQRKVNNALTEWIGLVTAQVKRNWLKPPDASDKFECKVQIEQLPGGQIVNRKMVQSCGSRLLDDSVLKAVDKSNPLPLVTDPAAFRRTFTFTFVPK